MAPLTIYLKTVHLFLLEWLAIGDCSFVSHKAQAIPTGFGVGRVQVGETTEMVSLLWGTTDRSKGWEGSFLSFKLKDLAIFIIQGGMQDGRNRNLSRGLAEQIPPTPAPRRVGEVSVI